MAAAGGASSAVATEAKRAPSPVAAEQELNCLALNVYHEARGEPLDGKLAVAFVTLNRVQHPTFPDTICGVVWQRGQFSWTHDGRPDRPYESEAWREALEVARSTVRGRPSNVGTATHFHAVYVKPRWSESKRKVSQFGRHVFYE